MAIPSPTERAALLSQKYPAHEHFHRVLSRLTALLPASTPPTGLLFLRGAQTHMHEDSDQAITLRQRRPFFYLSGCDLADCSIVYTLPAGHSTLFIPPVVSTDVVWSGMPTLPAEALARYDVDAVLEASESAVASLLATSQGPIWSLDPSHLPANHTPASTGDPRLLRTAIDTARVIKTRHELALLSRASEITSRAHLAALRAGLHATHEAQIEAAFHAVCIGAGARTQAYDSIVASGTAAATLHYVRNDAAITPGKTLNVLVDAGCEVSCYAADVTRTWPVGGRWTRESRAVYDVVREMQTACMRALRANVRWETVHELAHRVGIEGLARLGLLRAHSAEDREACFASRVSTAFFPHGLGHYLGMDTHDTGGGANYDDPDPMFRYLRVRGEVPAGAVITVEPGVYFCRYIVEPMLETEAGRRWVDKEVLERFWGVGGVRIEDDVVVTEEGCENLTGVTSDADEIERLMAGGE